MNDINIKKYDKIKEIRETIRTLSLNLGDLVEVLDNELIDSEAKEIIEEQAWKLIERTKEIIDEYKKKK